jgi:hypothetical protein
MEIYGKYNLFLFETNSEKDIEKITEIFGIDENKIYFIKYPEKTIPENKLLTFFINELRNYHDNHNDKILFLITNYVSVNSAFRVLIKNKLVDYNECKQYFIKEDGTIIKVFINERGQHEHLPEGFYESYDDMLDILIDFKTFEQVLKI